MIQTVSTMGSSTALRGRAERLSGGLQRQPTAAGPAAAPCAGGVPAAHEAPADVAAEDGLRQRRGQCRGGSSGRGAAAAGGGRERRERRRPPQPARLGGAAMPGCPGAGGHGRQQRVVLELLLRSLQVGRAAAPCAAGWPLARRVGRGLHVLGGSGGGARGRRTGPGCRVGALWLSAGAWGRLQGARRSLRECAPGAGLCQVCGAGAAALPPPPCAATRSSFAGPPRRELHAPSASAPSSLLCWLGAVPPLGAPPSCRHSFP